MMGEQMVTEREAVLRERAAFAAGLMVMDDVRSADVQAARRYPLPKITRSRQAKDPHGAPGDWSVYNGSLVFAHCGTHTMWPTPERVALWADLLANPTEDVDA